MGPDNAHFPWHYTEFGVVCVCGSAMRDEECLGQMPTDDEEPPDDRD